MTARMARATCRECGQVFEAPERYADLVFEGAWECAARDAEWAAVVLLASDVVDA